MNTNSNAPEVHALSDDGDHEIVEGADAANDIDQGQSPGSRLVTETLSRHKSTVSPPDAGRATAKPGFVLDFNLAPPAPVASRFQRGLQGRSAHEAKRPAVQGLGTRLDDSMKELSPSTSTSYSSFINANGTYPLASTHQPYANGSYDSVHTQAQHEEFAMHGEEEVGDDTTQYQQEPEDVYPTSPIVRPESRKLQARCAPSSGSGAGTTMVPSTNRSLSADILPRNIECRVRKSPQIGSPAHSTVRRQMAQVALEHPQRASARPSEEDLLLLLMRRQRLRTETHTRTLNSHDQLREDYAQLQRDNNACQQKLQEATAGWHTSMRTQHVQEAELKSFGEKYSKLKRWAEETRTLYDGLQADREILNEKVHAVKSDGIQNANEKREFLQKTANALQTVGTMKAAISELRLEAVKLEGVETQLAQERGRLRDEKLKNKSHALYIERLEASQRSLNSCFSKKQDEMGQQLAKIMRSVDNKDDTALTSSLAQIIDAIEQLRQQNFANEDNNQTLQTALASVGIHFDTLKASLEGLKNGQVDQHAASNLQLASLIDAVDKIKPDLERLQSLEQDSMALGSQLKRAESASKASEHDKNAIQLFCTGLLQAHKQLLDVRAASNQEAENAKIKQMEDTSKELHLKLNSSRSETSSLKTELENVRESLRETTTLLDAQEHHQEEQIEQARQEAWSRAAEQLNDMKAQLQAKNEDIGSKQEQVANLKGDIQKLRQEAARLNSQKEKLGEDAESLRVQLNQNESRTQGLAEERNTSLQRVGSLEQVESELAISKQKCSNLELAQQEYHKIQAAKADAEQRADKAQAHSQELEEKLRIAQEELQVSKKDCAALESSQRDRDQLHADNADLVKSLKETRVHGAQQGQQLQNVNHQLETLRGKCKELVFTKKKLEQRETDNATLKQTLNDAQAHSDQQQKQLNEANCQLKTLQGVSVDVKTLRQETASQEKQIDDLSSKCEDLKSQASRVPGLQQQVNEAAVRNNDLQNALATAEKAAGQVPNLQAQLEDYATRQDQLNKTQAELKDKTNVINVLQQRVQALESMESALKTATEESQAKDVEMAKMQDGINALEKDLARFEPIKEHISDAEMALLSEPIVLSLKTTIHQSQTQTDEIDGYNADDEHSVRPKRAANRGGCHDSEESIVVPDSQLQGRHLVNTTTSDLSDPPEFLDDFDSMFETNQLSQQTNGTTPGQVLKQVQDLSPTVPLARQQSFRPGTSNDEMLLRSSDAANFSPPSGQPKQSKAQVLVPASAHGNSPMKTRTGMEVRHSRDSTPMPRMDPSNGQVTNFSSPQILSRDNHAPNSAAKRKQTILQPASGAKQHRADMSRLATRATAVTPLSVRFSGHDTTYDLPDDVPSSTRKAGSAIGSSAPAPGKNKRRTNTTTRKAQKADRYGERFNGPK